MSLYSCDAGMLSVAPLLPEHDCANLNVMEVAMHDTRAQRRRMPHLNDLYRFSMAALGDRVGPLSLPPSIFYPVLPLTCMGQQCTHTWHVCIAMTGLALLGLVICYCRLPFLAHTTVVLQSAGTAAGRHQIGFHLKALRHDKLVQAMEILQQTLLCLLTQCLSPQWFYDRILIKARSPYQEAVAAAVAAACY